MSRSLKEFSFKSRKKSLKDLLRGLEALGGAAATPGVRWQGRGSSARGISVARPRANGRMPKLISMQRKEDIKENNERNELK